LEAKVMTTHPIFFQQPQASYRGRTSAPVVSHPRRWAIAGLTCAVLFSTAAAAMTLQPRFHQNAASEHSLAANNGLRPFGESFAELAW
jgi:hypothetical protein